MLCLVGSLLAHGLMLSLLPGGQGDGSSSPSGDARMTVFLSGPGPQLQQPDVTEKSTTQAKPAGVPVQEIAAPTPAQSGLPQAVDEFYVDPKDVDQMAFATEIPELPLPVDTEMPTGLLRLRILIGKTGKPDGVEVLETTLPEDYVRSLVDLFGQGVFQPAMRDGKPVKSWRIIEVVYGETAVASSPPAKAD